MPKLKEGKYRITRDGLHQIRYRRNGYNVQFTSKSKKEVLRKFKEWALSENDAQKRKVSPKATNFATFAEEYFQTVKRVNVEKSTYDTLCKTLRLYILPQLGDLSLKQITPMKCQSVLNGILGEGKERTAETVKFILGEILRAAVGEKLISENPMSFVKIPHHQRTTGTALSRGEVAGFLAAIETSRYRKQFLILLYTGIRRNELHGIEFEGEFMIVPCGKKRKGQKQLYRKIPISPEIRDLVPLSREELAVQNDVLTKNFKKLCPSHHLHDLRHTFTTRCQECGISKILVDQWTGHRDNRDMTSSVYTHFSDEFQLEEIKRLFY